MKDLQRQYLEGGDCKIPNLVNIYTLKMEVVNMRKAYPVIFTQTQDVVLIEVPDLSILSEGKDIADAIEMARDAIGINIISRQDNNETVPEPSAISDIDIEKGTFAGEGSNFTSVVDIDIDEYRRKVDNRTVRRNVTIPNWLNVEAEKAHINVSKVLQEALMQKLNVYR